MFNPFICERFELSVQSVCRIHSLDASSRNSMRVRRSHTQMTFNEGPLVSDSAPVPKSGASSAGTLFSSQGATSRYRSGATSLLATLVAQLSGKQKRRSREIRRVADNLGLLDLGADRRLLLL